MPDLKSFMCWSSSECNSSYFNILDLEDNQVISSIKTSLDSIVVANFMEELNCFVILGISGAYFKVLLFDSKANEIVAKLPKFLEAYTIKIPVHQFVRLAPMNRKTMLYLYNYATSTFLILLKVTKQKDYV